jgi:hypothetical protein
VSTCNPHRSNIDITACTAPTPALSGITPPPMLDLFLLYPPSIFLFWSLFASVDTPGYKNRLLAQNLSCQSGHSIVHVLSVHRPTRTPKCLDQLVSGGPHQVVISLRSGRRRELVRCRRLNGVSAVRSGRRALAYGASTHSFLSLILSFECPNGYRANLGTTIIQSLQTLELYQIIVLRGSPSRYNSSRAYLIYTMCVQPDA